MFFEAFFKQKVVILGQRTEKTAGRHGHEKERDKEGRRGKKESLGKGGKTGWRGEERRKDTLKVSTQYGERP